MQKINKHTHTLNEWSSDNSNDKRRKQQLLVFCYSMTAHIMQLIESAFNLCVCWTDLVNDLYITRISNANVLFHCALLILLLCVVDSLFIYLFIYPNSSFAYIISAVTTTTTTKYFHFIVGQKHFKHPRVMLAIHSVARLLRTFWAYTWI